MSKKLNISKQDLILRYKNKKLTLWQIADDFNCSATTIMNYMKKYNISRKPVGLNLLNRFHTNILQDYNRFYNYLNTISVSKLSWLTGFYEGEGNITTIGKFNNLQLSIAQKDKTPLLYIRKILKLGTITKQSIYYQYHLYKTGYVLALLKKMSKYMKSQKRIQKTYYSLKILNKIKDCLERE